jgi:hypothetical protein
LRHIRDGFGDRRSLNTAYEQNGYDANQRHLPLTNHRFFSVLQLATGVSVNDREFAIALPEVDQPRTTTPGASSILVIAKGYSDH